MSKSSGENNDSNVAGKMFSENTVAVLLMALGNTSISLTQYDMMSALDGNKTASSFQHQFRSVLKKARELKQRVEKGENFSAVQPGKKRSTAAANNSFTPPATPKKPKANPKPRTKKTKKIDGDPPTNELVDGFDDTVKEEQDWSDDLV